MLQEQVLSLALAELALADLGSGGCRPSSFAANGPPVSNATSGQVRESHASMHTLYITLSQGPRKAVKSSETRVAHEKTALNNQLHSLSTANQQCMPLTAVVI